MQRDSLWGFMRIETYFILPLAFLFSAEAQAQTNSGVLITEVQSNPAGTGTDDGEWIELHNTSVSTVSIAGWQLQDYVGSGDPANISSTSWVFSNTSSLAPGQVIVIAKSSNGFEGLFGRLPSYELGLGTNNSSLTPDLTAMGGNNVIALSNSGAGDAVVLKDESGILVDSVEWGTLDRDVVGTPADRPGDGESLVRVDTTGSSHIDFVVSSAPSPFVGYGSNLPPNISDVVIRPRHAIFGAQLTVSATITDMDGIAEASVYLSVATSSAGSAIMPYQQVTMTSTIGSRYAFAAPLENLTSGLGFNEPSTFHERYVRLYVAAEDAISTVSSWPNDATELENNENYRWRNVLPTVPSNVQAARSQSPEGQLNWKNLSVWVKGRATSKANSYRNDRINFTIDDGSSGIAVYSVIGDIPDIQDGTEVAVLGHLDQYFGLTQITEPALVIQVLDSNPMPVEPEVVNSVADLLLNIETLESRLITLSDLEFVEPTQVWGGEGPGGGSNYLVTDGTGQVNIRVWADVDLVGTNTPSENFSLTAIVSQRSTEGRDGLQGGYQLWPRSKDDVFVPPVLMPDAGTIPNDVDANVPGSADAGTTAPMADAGFREAPRPGEPPVSDDGCACQSSGVAAGQSTVLWILALFAGLFWRRRRFDAYWINHG